MGRVKRKSRKRKKVKYKKISLKLSMKQYNSLKMYCDALSITPVKYIKRSISRYLKFQQADLLTKDLSSVNQLDLIEETL